MYPFFLKKKHVECISSLLESLKNRFVSFNILSWTLLTITVASLQPSSFWVHFLYITAVVLTLKNMHMCTQYKWTKEAPALKNPALKTTCVQKFKWGWKHLFCRSNCYITQLSLTCALTVDCLQEGWSEGWSHQLHLITAIKISTNTSSAITVLPGYQQQWKSPALPAFTPFFYLIIVSPQNLFNIFEHLHFFYLIFQPLKVCSSWNQGNSFAGCVTCKVNMKLHRTQQSKYAKLSH